MCNEKTLNLGLRAILFCININDIVIIKVNA